MSQGAGKVTATSGGHAPILSVGGGGRGGLGAEPASGCALASPARTRLAL